MDAADSPLSIVIVGVGQGDFTAMERLDGDRQRLASPFTGKVCLRTLIEEAVYPFVSTVRILGVCSANLTLFVDGSIGCLRVATSVAP